MFDKSRFVNATLIQSDGLVTCVLCALPIADKEEYLDGGEGNSAHEECVHALEDDRFPFDREDTQANLDKKEYDKPISLLATLSKIEIKGESKKIKLTFEVKITEALAEICADLGIKAFDFLPGDNHQYSSAELDTGPIYQDQWFLDWSKTINIAGETYPNLTEIGHVGCFQLPKIITKKIRGRPTVVLIIPAQVWESGFELLKNAYMFMGDVVSLKLRKYARIETQQELPMGNNDQDITVTVGDKSVKTTAKKLKQAAKLVKEHPEIVDQALQDSELSAEAQEMAGDLDKKMAEAA